MQFRFQTSSFQAQLPRLDEIVLQRSIAHNCKTQREREQRGARCIAHSCALLISYISMLPMAPSGSLKFGTCGPATPRRGYCWGNWGFFILLFCSPGFCGVGCLLRALSSLFLLGPREASAILYISVVIHRSPNRNFW